MEHLEVKVFFVATFDSVGQLFTKELELQGLVMYPSEDHLYTSSQDP